MALDTQYFVQVSAGLYDSSQAPHNFGYDGGKAGDKKETILANNYFLDKYKVLSKGSLISFTATDATLILAMVTQSVSTGVTIEEITETLPPASVDTADISDAAITTAKLANAAVTADKIADSTVTSAKLADSTVTSAKLADSAVVPVKLADAAVTESKLADSAVTADKIADSTIVGGKIANSTITGANLALGVLPVYTAIVTTVAGNVNQTFSLHGLAATDVVQVTVHTTVANVEVVSAITQANAVLVVFNADPGNAFKLNITVHRP